jgi:hypothetical protein
MVEVDHINLIEEEEEGIRVKEVKDSMHRTKIKITTKKANRISKENLTISKMRESLRKSLRAMRMKKMMMKMIAITGISSQLIIEHRIIKIIKKRQ